MSYFDFQFYSKLVINVQKQVIEAQKDAHQKAKNNAKH